MSKIGNMTIVFRLSLKDGIVLCFSSSFVASFSGYPLLIVPFGFSNV